MAIHQPTSNFKISCDLSPKNQYLISFKKKKKYINILQLRHFHKLHPPSCHQSLCITAGNYSAKQPPTQQVQLSNAFHLFILLSFSAPFLGTRRNIKSTFSPFFQFLAGIVIFYPEILVYMLNSRFPLLS